MIPKTFCLASNGVGRGRLKRSTGCRRPSMFIPMPTRMPDPFRDGQLSVEIKPNGVAASREQETTNGSIRWRVVNAAQLG
jgi:hypothetical protein